MAVQIVYETHSTTIDNERGIASGWQPGELSEEGRRQAAELGERRPPVTQDRRLRECHYGELDGAPVTTLVPRVRFVDGPFPGGQSYRDVLGQTTELLEDIVARHEGGRVLLVAHSANRWALQCLLGGARLEDLVDAPFDWQPGWEFTA